MLTQLDGLIKDALLLMVQGFFGMEFIEIKEKMWVALHIRWQDHPSH